MKNFTLFFALILATFAFSPDANAQFSKGGGDCEAVIMDVDIQWSADCSEFTWSVIICNNSRTCTTPGGELNMIIEYCPFTFDFPCYLYPALGPQTCTMITGTGDGSCGYACVTAELDNNGDSVYDCDGC